MRYPSINKKILRLFMMLMIFLFGFQGILFFMYNVLFKDLWGTFDKQNLYSTYENSAVSLQESVTGYLDNPWEEQLMEFENSRDKFLELTTELYAFFDGPQFLDNQILADLLAVKAQNLVENAGVQSSGSLFSELKEYLHLHDLLIKQYATTLPMELEQMSGKLEKSFKNWNVFNFSILFLIMLLFLVVWFLVKRNIEKIVRPLELLGEQAREIEEGKHHEENEGLLAEVKYQEVYILAKAFIHMEITIRNQMDALQEKIKLDQKVHALEMQNASTQIALTQTENALMQSLVNPHFLFNSLNLLASFAIIEKAPRVHDYSLKIARYLRETLNYVGKDIDLAREFVFLEHYADIQVVRFGTRIEFHFFCEKNCEDAVIPSLILQPLVENSLVHGVGSYLENGRITVSAKKNERGRVLIGIEDNGLGMDAETLAKLQDSLHTPFEAGQKGTGIRSVLYRLEYYFSKDVKFEVGSEGNGTRISIEIPYRNCKTDACYSQSMK